MDLLKLVGMAKKGRTTSEFVTMIIAGLFTGGISTGLLDFSPDTVQAVSQAVGQGVETVQAVQGGELSTIDGLIRIVGLVVGGQVVSSYIKSRGDGKSAHVMAIAQAMTIKATEQSTIKPVGSIPPKPEGPENDVKNP